MISELISKGSSFEPQKLRDSKPNGGIKKILKSWEDYKGKSDGFINKHLTFDKEIEVINDLKSESNILDFSQLLWTNLKRAPDNSKWVGSRIPLPNSYVVPSEGDSESSYWESYFILLGLVISGNKQLAIDMVDNYAHLLEKHGLIPSKCRYYSMSSSQPPYFSMMVSLIVNKGWAEWQDYALAFRREYQFWMEGADVEAADGFAYRRVVKVKGYVLNRYWNDQLTKNEELFDEHSDLIQSAVKKGISEEEILEHLSAARESGWGLSSRWMSDSTDMTSIKTAHIIPIELNALLSHLEFALGKAFPAEKNQWNARVRERRSALNTLFWNGETYTDIDLDGIGRNDHLSSAMFYPLWIGAPGMKQIDRILEILEMNYLSKGGVLTSLINSGQNWDFPNIYPPIQWACIAGSYRAGNDKLAQKIAQSYTNNCDAYFLKYKSFPKKYNSDFDNSQQVKRSSGWSLGVYLACKHFIETGEIIS